MAEVQRGLVTFEEERPTDCVCPISERGRLPEKMYWAARNGSTEEIQTWLYSGGDVNATDHEGDTMLRGACRGGQNGVLLELLKWPNLHLNAKDSDLRTPLMKAARRGNEATVRILCAADVKCKLDYTAVDRKGNTALSLAVFYGHWNLALILLQERHAYDKATLDLTYRLASEKMKKKILAQMNNLGYIQSKKVVKSKKCSQELEGLHGTREVSQTEDALNLGTLSVSGSSDEEEEGTSWVAPSLSRTSVEPGPDYSNKCMYERKPGFSRGCVCTLNYKQFWSRPDLLRKGSEKDFMNLESLFTDLQYEFQGYWNLTKDKTLNILKEFSQEEHLKSADCAIVIIMSHGDKGSVFKTSDMQDISVPEVMNIFLDSKCPYLRGKPKIFLLNFCRGSDRHESRDLMTDNIAEPPRDILCVYSTTESFVSYRDLVSGSPFITKLCEVIAKHYASADLEEILRKFNESYMANVTPEIQNFRFQKKFYF